ncbi:PepSY-like domain-containing protein [Agriterribacter sp.]|uniref:PepSY-like domain-containing protein n=1 Tax=Agriterribacter sp. TaxID=2821509 RepID=UPI002C57F415|nr:PepSY-like domain-containing protein [Agriterribacter sp.]HRO47390.1 PepSY-like domain-containing protein [Agriterribacter sp.]HRQ19458.1 PepSY-like domain-containing protein [Agriterribacter sp.]
MKKILLLIVLAGAVSFIQTATAQIRKIPAEVTNAFSEKYDDAKNVEWKDNLNAFIASFEEHGEKYEAKFNKKGKWQSTEKQLEISDLPGIVNDGFEKSKYSEWEVKSVYEIELPGDVKQYRVRVAKSDIQQKNLLFNEKGKLLKDNLTL